MSKFVHKLEVREINRQFVVLKGLRLTHQCVIALIHRFGCYGARFNWQSNSRLEIRFADNFGWDNHRGEIIDMIVDGNYLNRAPGEKGGHVVVTYMQPAGRRRNYGALYSETYPQFESTAEWMLHMRQLFGLNWASGDMTSLH